MNAHVGRYIVRGANDFDRLPFEATYIHPGWEGVIPNNDLMLIKLDGQSDNPIVKINLESEVPLPGQGLTVLGFGSLESVPVINLPNVLQEVTLNYVPNDVCDMAEDAESGIFYEGSVRPDWLCASSIDQGTCVGDSGGPLILEGETIDDDVLVGVISGGAGGCANNNLPGLNQRVSYSQDWILDTACEISDAAPEYWECEKRLNPDIPDGPDDDQDNNDENEPEGIPVAVFVLLLFDEHPDEVGWQIFDPVELAAGGEPIVRHPIGTYTEDHHAIQDVVFLKEGKEYTFVIEDAMQDGLFKARTVPGTYSVVTAGHHFGRSLVSGGGFFGREESTNFVVPFRDF